VNDFEGGIDEVQVRALGRKVEIDLVSRSGSTSIALEGIRAAKARGVYKGRKPSIDVAEIRRLREVEKLEPAAIARRLGIGRASVYRLLDGGKGRAGPG
jgi:hypothetical protein